MLIKRRRTNLKKSCYFHGCERQTTEFDASGPLYPYIADFSTSYCSETELYRACE